MPSPKPTREHFARAAAEVAQDPTLLTLSIVELAALIDARASELAIEEREVAPC